MMVAVVVTVFGRCSWYNITVLKVGENQITHAQNVSAFIFRHKQKNLFLIIGIGALGSKITLHSLHGFVMGYPYEKGMIEIDPTIHGNLLFFTKSAISWFMQDQTLKVDDQKSEGHCIFIHLADMASTTIRMVTSDGGLVTSDGVHEELQLSPGPRADATKFKKNDEVADFVADPDCGLETINTYPYKRLERAHHSWDAKKYRARGELRYHLIHVATHVKGKVVIKDKLIEHFTGEGHKFPWAANLFIGTLNDFESAKARAKNNKIYSHPEKKLHDRAADHSVFVVGIDVSLNDPNDHYAVKCSWGENYGDKG